VRAPRLREIIEFAAIHRLPAIYNFRDYVEDLPPRNRTISDLRM